MWCFGRRVLMKGAQPGGGILGCAVQLEWIFERVDGTVGEDGSSEKGDSVWQYWRWAELGFGDSFGWLWWFWKLGVEGNGCR